MASNAPKLAGYDYEFVETPPNDLICLICTFVAKDPQQLTCCGKIFCQVCLEEQKKRSTVTNKHRCPQCREDNAASFADKMSKYQIDMYMYVGSKQSFSYINLFSEYIYIINYVPLLTCR